MAATNYIIIVLSSNYLLMLYIIVETCYLLSKNIILLLVMSNQQTKIQRYSLHIDISQRKAANPHTKAVTTDYLAFLLQK